MVCHIWYCFIQICSQNTLIFRSDRCMCCSHSRQRGGQRTLPQQAQRIISTFRYNAVQILLSMNHHILTKVCQDQHLCSAEPQLQLPVVVTLQTGVNTQERFSLRWATLTVRLIYCWSREQLSMQRINFSIFK